MLRPLGTVLCLSSTRNGALVQLGAALATGNHVLLQSTLHGDIIDRLPPTIGARITHVADWQQVHAFDAVLHEGDSDRLLGVIQLLSLRAGPIVRVQSIARDALADGDDYQLEWLLQERAITNNVAAAGGNASLMTIG
jgi:RHH-type proline utilization regulon transcriptional repressor/proline dehydrogenase/delta 1-pyrroline-5-carboxylate dehydrogenase